MPPASLQYEIEREIGAGATSRVHLAHLKTELAGLPVGTPVAVKRLREELRHDPAAQRAFLVEARAGSLVEHAGLATVLASGKDDEGPWQVSVFAPGETLRKRIDASGALPEPLLRTVAEQLAGGLAALHAAGWAHGDVKPENMRLDERGRALLLDLGFATPLDGGQGDEGGEQHAGSLAYLSPERVRGGPPSAASDVFALGISLYECATGAHPFLAAEEVLARGTGGSSGQLLARSLEAAGADRVLSALSRARFVPPSRLVPQLSPLFDQLLADALAREAAQRPSANELSTRFAEGEGGAWWRSGIEPRGPEGIRNAGSPADAHLTPLVGREAELERLVAAWDEVQAEGRGAALWLRGPEGIGKSRLLGDFALRVRRAEQPPMVLYGRCTNLEVQRPCAPVLAMLRRWLGLPQGTSPGPAERERVSSLVPPAAAETLLLAIEAGIDDAPPVAIPSALGAWWLALAERVPLIVYLDDVNFADEGTLAVISSVSERLAETATLFVLGERAYEAPNHPQLFERLRTRILSDSSGTQIELAPLDGAAVLAMVERLFHRSAPRRRIADVLARRSRGNPGLLAEILRDLIERSRVRPHPSGEDGWLLVGKPEDLPLPRSLRTSIQRRFERLSAIDRRWLQRLAVVGGRLDADFLLNAFRPPSEGTLDAVLTRLVHSGWLVTAGARYRFARPALREAAYRSIPEGWRQELHAEAARALAPRSVAEGEPARSSLEDALQRAFHLRAAGAHRPLLRSVETLIPVLLKRGQPGRVHTLAGWGLEALDALPATRARGRRRIRLLEEAADAADRLGRREVQRRWLDKLSDLELSPEEDPLELARVYLLHGRFAASTGQYGLARAMLRNASVLAETGEDDELRSEILRRLSAVQAHVGELDEARSHTERAIALAVHAPQEALAWLQKGLVQLLRDQLEDALRSVDRAMRLIRRASGWNLPGVVAAAHMLRGRIYRIAGRPRRALAALQHAVRMAQQAGERRLEMEATARLGGLLLDVDRVVEAEERLREALWMAQEIEDRRGRTLASLWLGILLWEQGDPEGPRLLRRATSLAAEMGLARAEALASAVQARTALEAEDHGQAERLSLRAESLLEAHGSELADRIVIVATRALVLHAAGREELADGLVRELRRRLRRENAHIENPILKRRQRVASTRLLETALHRDGWLYPRVALSEAGDGTR